MKNATIQDVEEAQRTGKLKEDVMYEVFGFKVHGKKVFGYLAQHIQSMLSDKSKPTSPIVLAETSDGMIIPVDLYYIKPLSKGGSAFTPRKPRRKPTKGTSPERKIPVNASTNIRIGDIVETRRGKIYTVVGLEGQFYELSDGWCVAKANLEYLILPYQEPVKEKVSYRIGDRFTSPVYGDMILAKVGSYKACLISLNGGNRFVEPVTTSHVSIVSAEEFAQISGGESFTKIYTTDL